MLSQVIFPVRYYETDQMGVVHHSNYIRYFECARDAMMNEAGYPIQRCEAEGVTVPVARLQCRYLHPLRMGDSVRAVAEVEKVPMAKLEVSQKVYNQNGERCAEGKVLLGFLSKRSGRPVRCPSAIAEAIQRSLERGE